MKAIMPFSTRGASEGSYGSEKIGNVRPCPELLVERPGVGRTRRGQIEQTQVQISDQFSPHGGRRRPVEGDRPQVGKIMEQMLDPVVLGLADRLVEAAGTAGRSDHVPQAD